MIYIIGFVAGVINGFFSSGAGNIIVLYLVFIKKIDTHVGRAVSIAAVSITSIISIFRLINDAKIEILKICILIVISAICGIIGSKIMLKINSKILNLISAIIITSLSIYGLIR